MFALLGDLQKIFLFLDLYKNLTSISIDHLALVHVYKYFICHSPLMLFHISINITFFRQII